MGCPCSRPVETETPSPLQQLQQREVHRVKHRRWCEQQRQRKLAKLHRRNAKKRRRKRGLDGGGSLRRSTIGAAGGVGVVGGAVNGLAPQLRLLGGSNGSSATECASALYARTLEQQREEHQRTIELKTGHQLEHQLHIFLLNQLVLTTQFFGHFEAELAAMDEQLQAKRRECAQRMTDQTLIFASAIDAAVAKRLKYKPVHGPLKHQSQLIQLPLIYVVFENVDIARPNDANYDSIATLCKVLMETDYYNTTPCRSQYTQMLERTRWKGYVRLKLREQATVQRSLSDDGVYTDGSSGYSTAASIYSSVGSVDGKDKRAKRNELDGIYDHVYISRFNTHRPIADLRLSTPRVPLQSNVLPEACVSRLANFVEPWLEASDDDEDAPSSDEEEDSDEQEESTKEQLENLGQGQSTHTAVVDDYETVQVLRQCRVEQERRRALLQQSYLNSAQFMNYFGDLLRQQLAPQLRIPHSQLAAGTYRGCSVYTASGEVIPAIHVPHSWPDCAFEFNLRPRPLVTSLHTGEQFQWPTPEMRKRIQSFGYHVVPVGYAPKRARNPFRDLEWRIIFPQAEQYLERQLTRTQLKVFMLMKVLLKAFVEPHEKGQTMMIHAVEHLRAHLFWECERHYNAWPEEFLGEVLVRFVRGFAACLAKKELGDYFIPARNLFEYMPEDALMAMSSIMSDIAEQPLMHVLIALRNLEHAPDFYPKMNYRRLCEHFVTKDYLKLRGWAKFARAQHQLNPEQEEERGQAESSDLKGVQLHPNDASGLLGIRQHQERTRGKLRRQTQLLRAQQQQKLAEQRRQSIESIDVELLVVRATGSSPRPSQTTSQSPTAPQLNDGVEILRRTNLLELLLDHLLEMIAKANEFHNTQHAQLYLEHAQRLCHLYKQFGCCQYAPHYTTALLEAAHSIEQARESSINGNANDNMIFALPESTPPALPRRQSASSMRAPGSSSSRRKSIKFVEHVVEVHTGDVSPLQQPYRHTAPAGILRTTSNIKTSSDEIIIVEQEQAPEEPSPELATEQTVVSSLGSLLSRLNVDPQRLHKLGAKTDEVFKVLAPETKRDELRNMLKRNTEKLKGAFNPAAQS